jgi:abelson tyrosine-protein kinase 1
MFFRLTHLFPGGTLRWQAPELMQGAQALTAEMDIYAFAICCVEILTKGALPWPLMDDNAVRHFVLSK